MGFGKFASALIPSTALLLCASGVQGQANQKFRWTELAVGVYAVSPNGMGSNTLVVIGSDEAMVVDAQQGTAGMALLLDELAEVTDVPVTRAVITHWHLDHSGGTRAIRERFPDAVVFAHEDAGTQARVELPVQAANVLSFWGEREMEFEVDRLTVEELADPAPFSADRMIGSDTTINVGGRDIRILARGAGHTAGDLAVHLPTEGILAAGDLMLPVVFSNAGSPVGHLATLRVFTALAPRIILGGHGDVFRDSDLPARQAVQLAAWITEVEALVSSSQASSPAALEALVPQAAALAGDLIGNPEGAAARLLRPGGLRR